MMTEYLEEACEAIDAGMFSGDPFEELDNREELRYYMARWSRALDIISARLFEEEEECE